MLIFVNFVTHTKSQNFIAAKYCVEKLILSNLDQSGLIQGLFTGKPEFVFYRAFIANTEIIKLSLFNIVPC
jgi:hypothetical protein